MRLIPRWLLVTLVVAAADVNHGGRRRHAPCACSRSFSKAETSLLGGGSSTVAGDEDERLRRRNFQPILEGIWTLFEEIAAWADARPSSCCFAGGGNLSLVNGRDPGAWRLISGHAGVMLGENLSFEDRQQSSERERIDIFARRLTLGHAGDVETLRTDIGRHFLLVGFALTGSSLKKHSGPRGQTYHK